MKKEDRVITHNTKHIRHTSVTVKQYLRGQLAKGRMQILVNLRITDTTNHNNESYDPYVHMNRNYDTLMNGSNNSRHSVDSSNDKILSVESQQYDAGVDNPIFT